MKTVESRLRKVLEKYNKLSGGFAYQKLNENTNKSWVTTYVDGMAVHHTDLSDKDYPTIKKYIEGENND